MKKKICVVTGSRADYGHLYWIIKNIQNDPNLELQLVVTGMHLSPEFGMTINDIKGDDIPVSEKIEMLLSSDTEEAIVTSMGIGMIGFANAYEKLKSDLIVVLGDRFEILSAVAASVPFRIPVAHIHGGEITQGAIDDQFRHAITKMSHIHFPATKEYAERIIQMGESPEQVFCFGTPGLDNISRLKLMDKNTLANELKINAGMNWGILTYHPVTLEKSQAKCHIKKILGVIKNFPNIYWVFTAPNADTESRDIIEAIKNFLGANTMKGKLFTSLGQLRYLSLLKNSVVMVGNSSSGIIEAPSFGLPVVNIGARQEGRIKAQNIIDVPEVNEKEISKAINRAISEDFRISFKGLKNPYGDGNASEKIVNILKTQSLSNKIKKKFYTSPR